VKRAVVVTDGRLQADAVLGALAASGFEAVELDNVSRVRSNVEAGAVAVVLGYAGHTGDPGHLAALAALPPGLRRACVVVLVGPGLATGDGTRAFHLGVDLVVAWHDTPRLGELIDSAVALKRTLVASLDPAAATRLGG
jgi:hypothetical protein